MNGQSGAGTAKNSHMGHEDKLTTLYLKSYDVLKSGAVLVYRSPDCTNNSGAFYSMLSDNGKTVNLSRDYNTADIKQFNMYDNDVSSVMVPFGY